LTSLRLLRSASLACAKKGGKAPPAACPARYARRVRNRSWNFRKWPPAPTENGARPVRRPRINYEAGSAGLPGRLATPERGPEKPKQQQQKNRAPKTGIPVALWLWLWLWLWLCSLGAPSAAVATVGKPAGRRARCAAFWVGTGMCRPKIPTGDTNPSRAAAGARGPGCAFLGSFLCTSKEVLLNSRRLVKVTPRGKRTIRENR